MKTVSHVQQLSELVSRGALASRWAVSRETIKRKERAGILTAIRFNARLLRYRRDEILRIEAEAEGRCVPEQTTPSRQLNGTGAEASSVN